MEGSRTSLASAAETGMSSCVRECRLLLTAPHHVCLASAEKRSMLPVSRGAELTPYRAPFSVSDRL